MTQDLPVQCPNCGRQKIRRVKDDGATREGIQHDARREAVPLLQLRSSIPVSTPAEGPVTNRPPWQTERASPSQVTEINSVSVVAEDQVSGSDSTSTTAASGGRGRDCVGGARGLSENHGRFRSGIKCQRKRRSACISWSSEEKAEQARKRAPRAEEGR